MVKCSKCGAEYAEGDECRDRFNACLALEYEHPSAFGAVHNLTVLCYMLQHDGYSHQGWLESRELLRQFVRQGVTPAEVRTKNRSRLDSGHRKWSVTQGARFSGFSRIRWTRTIVGVRLTDPETYCADVRLWAASVLEDTERASG